MSGRGRLARSIAALAGLLSFGCATAPFEAGCASAPGSRTQAPLVWRAQAGEPGGGILYLLGSIHFEAPDAPRFPSEIEAAFERSDELVVELDTSDPEGRFGAEYVERGRLEPPTRLADLLSPSTLSLLERHLDARGIRLASVEGMKPWYVTNLLAVLELQEAGYDADHGIDRRFIERAIDKPIVALETLEEQLDLLDRLPLRIQENLLKDALQHSAQFDRATDQLIDAWRRGDERALQEIVFLPMAERGDFELFYGAVFFRRNESMATRLVALSRDGKTRFVVLGAGHMLGARGIPALLCDRGFEVLRVSGGGRSPQLD